MLLAEDNQIQARMISLVLSRYNFAVEIASNGKEALERYQTSTQKNPSRKRHSEPAKKPYDLILMDVYMPLMDGITCVKKIRSYEKENDLPRIPIMIQTCDLHEMKKQCLDAGCDEVLAKPLDKTCVEMAKFLIGKKRAWVFHTNRFSSHFTLFLLE